MVNVSNLKKGDFVKALVDCKNFNIKAGDILRVIRVGRSRWDSMDYADVLTEDGYTVEIMKNYKDFEPTNR